MGGRVQASVGSRVIEVNAMGGEAKQYQVIVNRKRLSEYRITLATIYETLRQNNANIGGGYIEKTESPSSSVAKRSTKTSRTSATRW